MKKLSGHVRNAGMIEMSKKFKIQVDIRRAAPKRWGYMNCIHQADYWEEKCSACDGDKVCCVPQAGYIRTKRTSYYGKEVVFMNHFKAVNDKQLGVCLRMLYAEKIQGHVETVMNSKGKIEFHISIRVDEQIFERLRERYEILIS